MSGNHCSTMQMPCIFSEASRGQGPVSRGSRCGRTKHVSCLAAAPFDRPWAFQNNMRKRCRYRSLVCNLAALRQSSPHHQETVTNTRVVILPTSRTWQGKECRRFFADSRRCRGGTDVEPWALCLPANAVPAQPWKARESAQELENLRTVV